MNHPPAAGGKTAWGVSEIAARTTDDPMEILKIKAAAADFQAREEERLSRLKKLESQAGSIMVARKARRDAFEMTATGGDDFKKRQDEILRKMQEAKEQRRSDKKLRREKGGPVKQRGGKKKRKKRESSPSSDGESSSSDSSSSSGSSGSVAKKEGKRSKKAAPPDGGQDAAGDAGAPQAAVPDPESRRRAEEARAREREVKRKAKEQAAAWAAETRRKEAEAEVRRQLEAKQRAEEAEAKRLAEAREKAAEEAAKRQGEEAEARRKADEAEAKKGLFKSGSGGRKVQELGKAGVADKAKTLIGGFFEGQTVYAAKNITVKGNLVVKLGTLGRVIGPSENNPVSRIAVEFSKREDRLVGLLNVVASEIKRNR